MTVLPIRAEHLEAEQAVLGALLSDPDAADGVFDLLADADFAREAHRRLYRALRGLHAEGKPIDPVTVTAALRETSQLEAVGGVEYLSYLLDVVPSGANAEAHAAVVADRALERRLLAAAEQVTATVRAGERSGEALAQAAEASVLEATARVGHKALAPIHDAVWRVAERTEQRAANPQALLGISSGLKDLDELTGGWQPGQYILLAARPSEGKTALGLHCAALAARAGVPTLICSLEMGESELVVRLLAAEAGIDSRRIDLGHVHGTEWVALSTATAEIGKWPLVIDDTAGQTIGRIRATARREARQRGCGMVVIDYVQLVHGDVETENRNAEMQAVSAGIRALSRDLAIPVLACCQLNRQVETRGGVAKAKPRLADLRESGAFEQDADVVILLWNDPADADGPSAPLTLLVEKQRNGPTGLVKVAYHKATGGFTDWSAR